MSQLQLGDAVLDASGAYSQVYFFSHADKDVAATFVDITLESNHTLSLSSVMSTKVAATSLSAWEKK